MQQPLLQVHQLDTQGGGGGGKWSFQDPQYGTGGRTGGGGGYNMEPSGNGSDGTKHRWWWRR